MFAMRPMGVLLIGLLIAGAMGYLPSGKEHFLTDALLREVVDRMGRDLVDADSYIDFPPEANNRIAMLGQRSAKDLDTEEQMFPIDYDSLGDGNINPSIRDQEYQQHGSLWGSQYVSGGAGEGKQQLKPEGSVPNQQEVKTDATLPAYCNPPNPCPIGYTEDQGCVSADKFENTAAYSRRYQAAQDCMCDNEHMYECSVRSPGTTDRRDHDFSDNYELNRFFTHALKSNEMIQHKNLVAKKYHLDNRGDENPFLLGERLPVAAKKGINVLF